ncbi:unnamed protein product [Rhodiola kirilowii]
MATLKHLPFFFSLHNPKPLPSIPNSKKPSNLTTVTSAASSVGGASFTGSKWADRLLGDFHFLPTTSTSTSISDSNSPSATLPPLAPPDRYVSLPLDFYQVLGAESHFLGDGIRRAYEARVSKPPQYGFSQDALISRRQILQAACETLADAKSRREYNQGLVDALEDTILTDVPFEKVPGALCVLQEAGEAEIVLQVGESLLGERLPKSFKQDVVLAMSLAYVDLSRDAMSLSPPDIIRGCEVLERALKLLQEEGASSLAPDMQAQIDETLEEITPRCVLELLALPLDSEFKTEREEGLQGLRNILWAVGGGGAAAVAGGFTREDFMNEAFLRMTASEQVDLFVATPSNIPAESFEVYGVALALVAQAFIGKKPHLIKDADSLFQQLQQTKVTAVGNSISVYTPTQNREVDFALERGLCSLLVGELDECRSWLGLDSSTSPYRDPSIVDFVLENSKDDADDDQLPGLCKLLETWLMEVVFPRFRDTKDLRFKLGDYYDDPTVLKYLERLEGVGSSPLAAAAAIVKIGAGATAVLDNVKASALEVLQKVFPPSQGKESLIRHEDAAVSGSASAEEREQFYESIVNGESFTPEGPGKYTTDLVVNEESITYKIKDASVKIMCAGVVVGLVTIACLRYLPLRNGSSILKKEPTSASASEILNVGPAVAENTEVVPRMDARLAESIVREWQDVKSQALGPDHSLGKLSKVLDGQMLEVWKDRAAEIANHGWFWEYELLNLTIESLTVKVDGRRGTVEATIEESASLTDPAHPENNNSYNTSYTTRYELSHTSSGWKITEGAVLRS